MLHEFRCDVPTDELRQRLVAAPFPCGLHGTTARRSMHRDLFFDTPDDTLQRRGVTCRLRLHDDDRGELSLVIGELSERARGLAPRSVVAEVHDADPQRVLLGRSAPARRLQALVDPRQLEARVQLEVTRHTRYALHGWLARRVALVTYDTATVRPGGAVRSFHELRVRRLRNGGPPLEELLRAFQEEHGLRLVMDGKRERAQLLMKWMTERPGAPSDGTGRTLVLVACRDGRIACRLGEDGPRLPAAASGGATQAGGLLRQWFGEGAAEPRLLGVAPVAPPRPPLEVWIAQLPPASNAGGIGWLTLPELVARAAAAPAPDWDVLAALTLAARADALAHLPGANGAAFPSGDRSGRAMPPSHEWPTRPDPVTVKRPGPTGPAEFLNSELSLLEFNGRVLALAEDASIPLLERLRFLAIFGSNLDEFFMVRVGALKRAAMGTTVELSEDGLTPREQLEAIAMRVSLLASRASRCVRACLAELARHGVRVLPLHELDEADRAALREYFLDEIHPLLTPLAVTLSPGHPLPWLQHLSLSLALTIGDERGGPVHFAEVEMPDSLPRFVPLPGRRDFVLLEDVLRANLDVLNPGARVDQTFLFRVTRGGDLALQEEAATNLVHAVTEATRRRTMNAVVRIEIEQATPPMLRDLLLETLRRERSDAAPAPTEDDVYEVEGLVDVRALGELASLAMPELQFPPMRGRAPLPDDVPLWDLLRERDVLVHHPYDDFDRTVLRLFTEAAADPDVSAIKATLYRAGAQSPVVDALLAAAAAGKEVTAFVELKARFDEERNVAWAKRLEQAGANVVYGLVGLKNHAKMAMVVRREQGRLRRYVHIGTGNYNAETARRYTDLGLLTTDEGITADVSDLFNELTGSSRAPHRTFRRCLVAPTHLLPALLSLVAREAEHARAGRGGRIRLKVNGLSDPELIRALYQASQAGVEIDLVVRGICTLRPGVTGRSERIRVVSTLGRFLEHARIYEFGNGGAPEYFLGSADPRPRNLRRRVEILAPVTDRTARERLAHILDAQLEDPTAWVLLPHGEYVRRPGGASGSAQDRFAREAAPGVGASA